MVENQAVIDAPNFWWFYYSVYGWTKLAIGADLQLRPPVENDMYDDVAPATQDWYDYLSVIDQYAIAIFLNNARF